MNYQVWGAHGVFFDSAGSFQLPVGFPQPVRLHGGLLAGELLENSPQFGIGADDYLTIDFNGTQVINYSFWPYFHFYDEGDTGIVITSFVHAGTNTFHATANDPYTNEDYGLPQLRITVPASGKFRVTFAPDTIKYGDTSAITVTAVDANNNPVVIPDTTHLILTVEQDTTHWAHFLSPSGAFVFSPYQDAVYGDARSGRIKLISLFNFDTLGGLRALKVRADGGLRVGVGSVYLGTPKLRFDGPDSADVFPHYYGHNSASNQHDTIGVILRSYWGSSSIPAPNVMVKLGPPILIDSGGHNHPANTIPPRPRGTYQFKNGTQWTYYDSLQKATDGSGALVFRFNATEFSGEDQVKAVEITHEGPTVLAVKKIRTAVPGLVGLSPGNHYVLVGTPNDYDQTDDPCQHNRPTSMHYGNHYGVRGLVQHLQAIADGYDSLYPGIRLRINDMSLVWGGHFDINNNWQGDHAEHRIGWNADVDYLNGIDQLGHCVPLHERRLRSRVDLYERGQLLRHVVRPHYHIREN